MEAKSCAEKRGCRRVDGDPPSAIILTVAVGEQVVPAVAAEIALPEDNPEEVMGARPRLIDEIAHACEPVPGYGGGPATPSYAAEDGGMVVERAHGMVRWGFRLGGGIAALAAWMTSFALSTLGSSFPHRGR